MDELAEIRKRAEEAAGVFGTTKEWEKAYNELAQAAGRLEEMSAKTEVKKPYLNFLNNLADFLGSSEDMTSEEIRQELEEEGIDVDASIERVKQLVERLKATRGRGV